MFDGDLKPSLRKGKGEAYIKDSQMRQSETWVTETEIFGHSQDNEKRCIHIHKTQDAKGSHTNMNCLGMLFTLTTGEEHITRLCLKLKLAEFLTDVQTILITVLLLNLLFRLLFGIFTIHLTKLAFLKNSLTLITVLITVLLSVMLFGLFTVQLKKLAFLENKLKMLVFPIIGCLLSTISFLLSCSLRADYIHSIFQMVF